MNFLSSSAVVIFVFAVLSGKIAANGEDESITASIPGFFNAGLIAKEQMTNGVKSPRVGQSCGRSKYSDAGNMDLPRPRIVGGQQARSYEFPWQASLRYNGVHFCGATIIGSLWVVTTASCLEGYTLTQLRSYMTVAVGEHLLNDVTSTVRQVIGIADTNKGNYSSGTFINDIALLKLSGSITFNENVTPICLPYSTTSFDFQKSIASGWGVTNGGSSTVSNTLLYTTLNITTNSICNAIYYTRYSRNRIDDGMMCTRDNIDDRTRDTCQGDAGGPVAVKSADGTFTLAGMPSWGINCSAGFPGVNTRVSIYVNSITRITGIVPQDIDQCLSGPCQNGGTCIDLVNDYYCFCVAGYDGDNCQTNINECSGGPCQHGGTCIDGVNGYSCRCVPGYTGSRCQTDVDECSSSPCQHGGTCVDGVNSYWCQCVASYTGSDCQTVYTTPAMCAVYDNVDGWVARPCSTTTSTTNNNNSAGGKLVSPGAVFTASIALLMAAVLCFN